MSDWKSMRLIFDNHVIETETVKVAPHAAVGLSAAERVGNYICNVLSVKFSLGNENSMQEIIRVDRHALDKPG